MAVAFRLVWSPDGNNVNATAPNRGKNTTAVTRAAGSNMAWQVQRTEGTVNGPSPKTKREGPTFPKIGLRGGGRLAVYPDSSSQVRAWMPALATVLGACESPLLVDLSEEPDGVHVVALFDPEGSLVRSLPPIRLQGGRRLEGERIGSPIAAEESPWLFHFPEGILQHELGPVSLDAESVGVEGSGIRSPQLAGTRLTLSEALPPETRILRIPDEGGRPETPRVPETRLRLSTLALRRTVQTEPCDPPVPSLSLFVPGERNVFRGLPPPAGAGAILDVRSHPPDGTVVLAENALVVLRGRALPTSTEATATGRDWLTARDFAGERVRMRQLLPIGDSDYLVLGRTRAGGQVWRVSVSSSSLVPGAAPIASFPTPLFAGVQFGSRFAVIDENGAVFEAEAPEGPWRLLTPGIADGAPEPDDVRLAGDASGRLARSSDNRIDVLAGPAVFRATLVAPRGRRSNVRSLIWSADGRLWAGTRNGDLFALRPGEVRHLGDRHPPRLSPCAGEAGPLDAVHVDEPIESIGEVSGHLLLQFDRCAAVVAYRTADLCAGLLTWPDAEALAVADSAPRLFAREDRLFVTGDRGLLYFGESNAVD